MKRIKRVKVLLLVLILSMVCAGCATTAGKAFEMSDSQVKLRAMQTRAFDMTDKKKMMQTAIGAMQDLDFIIDKADYDLGTITGTKFLGIGVVVMTVSVRQRGEKQLLVRASAQYGTQSVNDPVTYQDFFNTLEKALFLTAQQVD